METLQSKVCPGEAVSIYVQGRTFQGECAAGGGRYASPSSQAPGRTENQGQLCQRAIILGPLPTSLAPEAHDSSTRP